MLHSIAFLLAFVSTAAFGASDAQTTATNSSSLVGLLVQSNVPVEIQISINSGGSGLNGGVLQQLLMGQQKPNSTSTVVISNGVRIHGSEGAVVVGGGSFPESVDRNPSNVNTTSHDGLSAGATTTSANFTGSATTTPVPEKAELIVEDQRAENSTDAKNTTGAITSVPSQDGSLVDNVKVIGLEEVVSGHSITDKLFLKKVVLNRLSLNSTTEYTSINANFLTTVSHIESGQVLFYVEGRGNQKTVYVKSVVSDSSMAKKFVVENGVVAFQYDVSASNPLEVDRWFVKIENDLKDVVYYYMVLKRDL